MINQALNELAEMLAWVVLELHNMALLDLSELDPHTLKALRRKHSARSEVMHVATLQSVALTTDMMDIIQGQKARGDSTVQ